MRIAGGRRSSWLSPAPVLRLDPGMRPRLPVVQDSEPTQAGTARVLVGVPAMGGGGSRTAGCGVVACRVVEVMLPDANDAGHVLASPLWGR